MRRPRSVLSGRAAAVASSGLLWLAAVSGSAQDAGRGLSVARAKACFETAQQAYAEGKLPAAREGFTCAYELAPSPELAWNLARVYERMGEVSQSIRFYRLYLASTPADARTRKDVEHRVAALEALRQRQSAQVKSELPSEVQLGEEARAFFVRGVKLYRRGRYDAALVAFSAALRLSGAPELRYNLAVTAERLGQLSDALDHYRAYLAARPDADDHAEIQARIDSVRAKLP